VLGGLWLGLSLTGGIVVLAMLLILKLSLFQKTKILPANKPEHEMFEPLDLIKLTQEYPFYSVGVAATTGFLLAGGITAQTFKDVVIPFIKKHIDSLGESPSSEPCLA
jgi:hypothetical protein